MSVAPLAIRSFCTLFFLSSNTVLPVKSLIAIMIIYLFCVLVIQKLNFVVQQVVSGRRGGGGGGVVSESTEFCTFSCSPKAAVPCSNLLWWLTIFEFYKFYSPFGIADRVFLLLT